MLRRERERTEEIRRRGDEERKHADERIETLMNELREERRKADERIAEERRQSMEKQRAMVVAITGLAAAIAELRQQNGTDNGEDNDR